MPPSAGNGAIIRHLTIFSVGCGKIAKNVSRPPAQYIAQIGCILVDQHPHRLATLKVGPPGHVVGLEGSIGEEGTQGRGIAAEPGDGTLLHADSHTTRTRKSSKDGSQKGGGTGIGSV